GAGARGAGGRNWRRLRSTSSSAPSGCSAINLSRLHSQRPPPTRPRLCRRANAAVRARVISYLAGGGALYTNEHPLPGARAFRARAPWSAQTMLNRLGRGLVFIAGSVVGGLALALVVVAPPPALVRG